MNKDNIELIYECLIFESKNRINYYKKISRILKNGLNHGKKLFDIVFDNFETFFVLLGLISSGVTVHKLSNAYQNNPEYFRQHQEYVSVATGEIVKFLEKNPHIIDFLKDFQKNEENR